MGGCDIIVLTMGRGADLGCWETLQKLPFVRSAPRSVTPRRDKAFGSAELTIKNTAANRFFNESVNPISDYSYSHIHIPHKLVGHSDISRTIEIKIKKNQKTNITIGKKTKKE